MQPNTHCVMNKAGRSQANNNMPALSYLTITIFFFYRCARKDDIHTVTA